MGRRPSEMQEPLYRAEIARRLRGKIRIAARDAGLEVRVFLSNEIEKILNKQKMEK